MKKPDWEKRFEKMFPDFSDLPSSLYKPERGEIVLRKNIKQFISQELKKEREKELMKLEHWASKHPRIDAKTWGLIHNYVERVKND